MRRALIALVLLTCAACGGRNEPAASSIPSARNLVLITIDTLRADRVGAYGYVRARTPAFDAVAKKGARFTHAYAAAPITLTSHASLMTGRYPPGHGARHNGMRIDLAVPTLADALARQGFATGAFVSAFPLDRRFGLIKGFGTYSDRMPAGPQGRLASERPGRVAADEAIAWLAENRQSRFFLWLHLFEPHAPYGNAADRRPVDQRYDDEVAEADRQVGRVLETIGAEAATTLTVIASDHGEAFGEHGETGHSIFVYDTTLRVPLAIAGAGIAPRTIDDPVALIDIAPTVLRLLGVQPFDSDGVDLGPALGGGTASRRELYAESFAPLLDFGWSPLRTLRADGYKYIAAPRPELYRVERDATESRNLIEEDSARAATLDDRVQRISPATLAAAAAPADPDAAARLQALGYTSRTTTPAGARPDPKDKRELASRIAQVTSGEMSGDALQRTLEQILKDDPGNPQAHLRLGYVLADRGDCAGAEPHFRSVIAAKTPTADAHLGLAGCQVAARRFSDAAAILRDAEAVEPDNPVVVANRGVVLSDGGRPLEAVPILQRALTLDPDFHQARFNLALAYARAGRRSDAAREASDLLRRLPASAPQRPEVERLLAAVR